MFSRSCSLLLATLQGATRVKVFNSTVSSHFLNPIPSTRPTDCHVAALQIRRKKHDAPAAGTARTPENTGPVSRAHNDNTPLTGAKRVMLEMGDEAEELSKGRCQIINVWRPLAYPAQDCPLAAMDYRSLDEKDLVPTDLILSNEGNRRGENYSVRHNEAQKWYYLSNQTPSEP